MSNMSALFLDLTLYKLTRTLNLLFIKLLIIHFTSVYSRVSMGGFVLFFPNMDTSSRENRRDSNISIPDSQMSHVCTS